MFATVTVFFAAIGEKVSEYFTIFEIAAFNPPGTIVGVSCSYKMTYDIISWNCISGTAFALLKSGYRKVIKPSDGL